MPASSSTVGRTSTAWANWRRIPPLTRNRAGPTHDAGVGHPSLVDLPLPSLEGGVAGHGPTPGVIVVGAGSAQLVDTPGQLRRPAGSKFCRRLSLIEPLGAPLRAGPVVRDQNDQGVLTVSGRLEKLEHPGQLGIGVGEERGEALHEPSCHPPLLGGEVLPGRHPRRSRGHLGTRCEQAGLQLAGEDLLPPLVPTLVEVPGYRSIHSRGAWWGEWQAPVQK